MFTTSPGIASRSQSSGSLESEMFRSLGRFSNCWNFSLFYIFHLSGIGKFKTPECPCEPPPEPLSDSRGSLNFHFSWRKSAKVGLRRFCQYRFKMKNGVQRTMKHFDKLPCQRSWRAFLLGRGYLVVVITCSKKAPERVQASTSSCQVFADYFKTPHRDKFVFSQESRKQKWTKKDIHFHHPVLFWIQ